VENIAAYGKTNPTQAELETAIAYGRHWAVIGDNWNCPGCERTAQEITRWHKGQNWGRSVVKHHDHLQPGGVPRFANVIVCEDCNKVDATIKHTLRRSTIRKLLTLTADELLRRCDALRLDFSLSPAEIHEVVIARPHQRHVIRLDRAYPIVRRIAETFYAGPNQV
jgi:rubredoxin